MKKEEVAKKNSLFAVSFFGSVSKKNASVKELCVYDVSNCQDIVENGLLEIEMKEISVPDFLVFKNQHFKEKNLKNFAATCYVNGYFFSESLEKLISKLEELK